MPTLTWSNGYIRNDTGAVGSDPKGLVSNTFAGDGRPWHVSVATGFKIIKAARYGGSSRGTFEEIIMPLGEYTDFDITFENGKYYSFALTNADVTNISPSDVSNDTVEMTAYGVTISYQNSTIATMGATGMKTLLTGSTFCEDDIVVSYTALSLPSGTKNISISSNGTTTTDVANYATASIIVAVPQPSGSMTVVASGTYTGTGGYPSSAGTGFFVGTKMPKTDFWFRFCASSDSEFAYNTDYKYAYGLFAVFSEFGHYDLSTVGDSKQMISDITFDINNSGTVTATNAGIHIGVLNCVRNASATTTTLANNLRIDRRSNGFYVRPYQSNTLYKYVSGMTYNWELVYFGSNPSTDIVGVS